MNEHTASEIAYKNGYEKGKADGAREIFEEIERWLVIDGDIRLITAKKFAELKDKFIGGK